MAKPLSEKLGFSSYTLFTYKLTDKNHTEKVKFNYKLSGRNKNEGILKLFKGKSLGPGALLVPISFSLEFEEILKLDKINYSKKNVLIQN